VNDSARLGFPIKVCLGLPASDSADAAVFALWLAPLRVTAIGQPAWSEKGRIDVGQFTGAAPALT